MSSHRFESPGGDPRLRYEKEVTDRLRRMETRLTKLAGFLGFDMSTQKPWFEKGIVHVKSRMVSLADVMAAIPPEYDATEDGVCVTLDGEELCWLYPPGEEV
jgi:hypothetical protein